MKRGGSEYSVVNIAANDWAFARSYAWLYGRVKDATGINLRGLGWMLRRVQREHVFRLAGQQMVFDPAVAGCYDRMIAGEFNEAATYRFLLRAIDSAGDNVTFVEVGANVGELLIPIAAHPHVRRAIGYEPHPVCASVCARSAQLNQLQNVELRHSLVGNGTIQPFYIDHENPNASAIGEGEPIQTVTLDDDLPDLTRPVIMLVDVEGAEPLVLDGARRTIAALSPLVIFEYNHISKRHYKLEAVAGILGARYDIYRLRSDSRLDDRVEASWNCVAIPRDTEFEGLCA